MCKNFLCLLLLWPVLALAQADVSERSYVLGTGDVVAIEVFGEEDLSQTKRVGDSGLISYPFLGEVKVAGMTVAQLENHILNGLKGPYLVDPKITVSVNAYRPFYISGEVKSPGSYPYEPDLTVRKAVVLAGGFTERASRKKVTLISENAAEANGENAGRQVDLDTKIGAGDQITIGQSFF